jgi:hypothetical protein
MNTIQDEMYALLSRMAQRGNRIIREKRRKRNMAAIVDFVSNVLVTSGRTKGVGMQYRTPVLPRYEKEYRDTCERLEKQLLDYGGRVARTLFDTLQSQKREEKNLVESPKTLY